MTKLKNLTYSLLWMCIVTFLSLKAPSENTDSFFSKIPHFDKFVHFFMYLILAFLLGKAFIKIQEKLVVKTFFVIFLFCYLYGSLMEYLQGIMELGRTPDVNDIYFNIFGAVNGIIILILIEKHKAKERMKKRL